MSRPLFLAAIQRSLEGISGDKTKQKRHRMRNTKPARDENLEQKIKATQKYLDRFFLILQKVASLNSSTVAMVTCHNGQASV